MGKRSIGIDPGSHTGFAVVEHDKLIFAKTFLWGKQREELESACAEWGGRGVRAVVEVPRGGVWIRPGLSPAAMRKLAVNVGQCHVRALEIARLLERAGCDVISRPPLRGGTKRALSLATWRAMFPEWKRRISSHARDAAVLARVGRTLAEEKGG